MPGKLGQLRTGQGGKGLLRSRLWCAYGIEENRTEYKDHMALRIQSRHLRSGKTPDHGQETEYYVFWSYVNVFWLSKCEHTGYSEGINNRAWLFKTNDIVS